VLAVDGTKLHANASQQEDRDYEQITREILAEADAVDHAEDERFGERRGDELPPELATEPGRRGWLREVKRPLDEERAAAARPVPKSLPERLHDAGRQGQRHGPRLTQCQDAVRLHAGLQGPGGLQHSLGLRRTRRPAVEGVLPLWLPPDPPSGLSLSP
jgi:hypothetical protein